MTSKEICVVAIGAVVGAVVGGSGVVGLAFYFLRRYIEKKLTASEDEAKKRRADRIKKLKCEEELHHAYGRLLFWVYRFIMTGQHNGDLDRAFNELQEAEAHKKDLDREIIAECEQNN